MRVAGGRNQNKRRSTGFDLVCGEICVLMAVVFVSQRAVQTASRPPISVSPLHPCLTLMGCHCQVTRGEVNGGSGVNQGSWIYGWQTSLPPQAPVSAMKLRPLGGMGSTLSLCAYIGVWGCLSLCLCVCVSESVCECVCERDTHLIVIAAAISVPCGCPLSNSWSGVNQSSPCRCAVSQ